jgi:hypothetical protein
MERGHPGEDAIVAAKLHEVARRDWIALMSALGQPVIAHNHEFTELGIRVRSEQERVQNTERGGVEPQSCRQDKECTSRKTRALGETPSDETHVTPHDGLL